MHNDDWLCFLVFEAWKLKARVSFRWDWSGLPCLVQLLIWLGPTRVGRGDDSLWIYILSSNNCFSHRNVFQNGVNTLSKIVNHFLSKSTKFCMVRSIRFCSNCTSMWFKHVSNNVWRDFRLSMSASASQGNYATVGSAIVAIAIVERGGWAGLSSTVAI